MYVGNMDASGCDVGCKGNETGQLDDKGQGAR